MYCEEIDWAWRIREAGWEIMVVPAAEIIHFGGESTSQIPAQSSHQFVDESRQTVSHSS